MPHQSITSLSPQWQIYSSQYIHMWKQNTFLIRDLHKSHFKRKTYVFWYANSVINDFWLFRSAYMFFFTTYILEWLINIFILSLDLFVHVTIIKIYNTIQLLTPCKTQCTASSRKRYLTKLHTTICVTAVNLIIASTQRRTAQCHVICNKKEMSPCEVLNCWS